MNNKTLDKLFNFRRFQKLEITDKKLTVIFVIIIHSCQTVSVSISRKLDKFEYLVILFWSILECAKSTYCDWTFVLKTSNFVDRYLPKRKKTNLTLKILKLKYKLLKYSYGKKIFDQNSNVLWESIPTGTHFKK